MGSSNLELPARGFQHPTAVLYVCRSFRREEEGLFPTALQISSRRGIWCLQVEKCYTMSISAMQLLLRYTAQITDPLHQVHLEPQVCAKHYSNGWEGTNQQEILISTCLHFSDTGNKPIRKREIECQVAINIVKEKNTRKG